MNRSDRRSLTLLETLLASAILAVMAATCVPMLSAALRALTPPTNSTATNADHLFYELAELADAFMANPESFGCKDFLGTIQRGDLSIQWPDGFGAVQWPSVSIHALRSSADESDHLWLVFNCDGQSIARYLALPKSKTKEASIP